MKIDLPPDLASRLFAAARRLGRTPEDCALAAITAFVQDCEEAARTAERLGGGVVRIPSDDFMD